MRIMMDVIDPKLVVYEMVCDVCGHVQKDNLPWTKCLIRGCSGVYIIIAENPAGH
jgi:uncharacterized metal-binding protein